MQIFLQSNGLLLELTFEQTTIGKIIAIFNQNQYIFVFYNATYDYSLQDFRKLKQENYISNIYLTATSEHWGNIVNFIIERTHQLL